MTDFSAYPVTYLHHPVTFKTGTRLLLLKSRHKDGYIGKERAIMRQAKDKTTMLPDSQTTQPTKLSDCKTIKARKAFIRSKIETSDTWCVRALIAIYRNQTPDEQASHTVVEDNGIGFAGPDGSFGTKLAQQVISRMANPHNSRPLLSDKQMACARKMMVRYAGQLEKLSRPAELKHMKEAA